MRSQDDELLLTGHAVPGDDALADVLGSLRAMAQEPAPAPNAALAALLEAGLPRRAATVPLPLLVGRAVRQHARAASRWVGGLGLAGKVVLGAGMALAAVTGAATIPAVPDVVQLPAQTVLSDVGRAFGGGVAATPSPGTSTGPASDDARRQAPAGGTSGQATDGAVSDDAGTAATKSSSGDREVSGPETPGRSGGNGGGTLSAPGQSNAVEQGGQGRASSGTVDSSATDEGSATGPDGWMTRKQDSTPTPTPSPTATRAVQPTSSPRADAGGATSSSER